jgi:hypothetical protein
MILLLLWAFAGVLLGYESARHGIVQVVVPTLYLLAMFAWLVVGFVLIHFVTSRKARPIPSAADVRRAYTEFAKTARDTAPEKRGEL